MKVKPVLKISKPGYPDKYEIDLNKELLRYRPKRWLRSPIVNTAFILLLMAGSSGCRIFGMQTLGGDPPSQPLPMIYESDVYELFKEELEKAGYDFIIGRDEVGKGYTESYKNYFGFEEQNFDAQVVLSNHIKCNIIIKHSEYMLYWENVRDNKYDPTYSSYEWDDKNVAYFAVPMEQNPENTENIDTEGESLERLRTDILEFIGWLNSLNTY